MPNLHERPPGRNIKSENSRNIPGHNARQRENHAAFRVAETKLASELRRWLEFRKNNPDNFPSPTDRVRPVRIISEKSRH
jgi:hypothetical protein